MEQLCKANRISNYNMRMLTENYRILTMGIVVFLFILQNLSDVLMFSKSVNIPVTGYGLVFLVNDYRTQFILTASAVVIFSNAPFESDGHYYLLARSGRIPWALGQIIYIFKVSIMYIAFLMVASVIPFIGNLKFEENWGKIWGTLAKTDAGSQIGMNFTVSELIVSKYEPLQALIYTLALEFGCILWIGLIVYLGNKIADGSLGTIIGVFFTLMDICISNDWMDIAYGFSPVSLAQISIYSGYRLKWHIDLGYGIRFFIMGNIILMLLCILANHKEKIIKKYKMYGFSKTHRKGMKASD